MSGGVYVFFDYIFFLGPTVYSHRPLSSFLQDHAEPDPIPLCPSNATLTFRWHGDHGVWQLPSPQCPSNGITPGTNNDNDTGTEIFPVQQTKGAPQIFTFPADPPVTYYFTSQAPGDCGQPGFMVTGQVVGGDDSNGTRSTSSSSSGRIYPLLMSIIIMITHALF